MNWLHRYCSSIVKKDHVIWFFFRIYRCVVCLIYLWSISSSDTFHIWLLSSLTSFSNIMIWFIFQNSNHLCILYHICWVVRHCYSNDEYIDGILKGRRFLVSAKGCCIFQNEKIFILNKYLFFVPRWFNKRLFFPSHSLERICVLIYTDYAEFNLLITAAEKLIHQISKYTFSRRISNLQRSRLLYVIIS